MSSVFAGLCVECAATPYKLFLGTLPQLAVHQRLTRHMQPVHAWYATRKRVKEQANEYMELDLASCDAEMVLRYAHVHYVRRNVYQALLDKQLSLLEASDGNGDGSSSSKAAASSSSSVATTTSATTARLADTALLTCLAECNQGCIAARLHDELQTLQAAKRTCTVAGRRELDATLPLEPYDYLCMMRVVEQDATADVHDAEMRARAYLPRAHVEAKASELVRHLLLPPSSNSNNSNNSNSSGGSDARAPRATLDRREQKLLQRMLPGDYVKVGAVEKLRPIDVTAYYAFCAERLCGVGGNNNNSNSSSSAATTTADGSRCVSVFTRALWAHVFRKFATHPGYLTHISCYWAHHSGLSCGHDAALPSSPHMPRDVARAVCTQQQLFPALKYRAQYLYTAPEHARQHWRGDCALPLLRVYGALGAHAAEHLAAGLVVEAAWSRLQLAADDTAMDEDVLRRVREHVTHATALRESDVPTLLKRVEEGAQLLCSSAAAADAAMSLYTDTTTTNTATTQPHVAHAAALVHQLRHALAANDVNACCALLRRVYGDATSPTATTTMMSDDVLVGGRGDYASSSSSSMQRLLTSLQQRVVAQGLVQLQQQQQQQQQRPAPSPRRPPRRGTITTTSTTTATRDVHSSSVDVLCYTAQSLGDWAAALACARYLPHRPSPLFLSALLTPHNTEAVLRHCERRGWAIDVTNAMRVLTTTHGSWASALAVARVAERQCVYGEVYSLGVLVPLLAASGAHTRAAALFDAGIAHGALVDATLVQHLLLQSAALRQWRLCLHMLHVLHTTRETAQLLPRAAPQLFRRLLEASPSWAVSLAVLQHARACDLVPDATSLSIVLAQCDAAGAWAAATRVYEAAVRDGQVRRSAAAAATNDSSSTSLSCDTPPPPWRALVHALTTQQAWQKALEALSWMGKARDASRMTGLAAVVESCAQAGQWQMALMVGKQLLLQHRVADAPTSRTDNDDSSHSSHSSSSSDTMRASSSDDHDADKAVLLSSLVLHSTPRTQLALLHACAQGAQWQFALRLFRASLRDVRVSLHPLALCTTLQATAAAGRWGEAVALLAEARAARPRVVVAPLAHRLTLKTCVRGAQWQAALHVLDAMRDDGVPRDRQCQQVATYAQRWCR